MAETLNTLLDATKAAIDALGLTIGGRSVTARRRKTLDVDEQFDALPFAAVAGTGPDTSAHFDSEGNMLSEYTVSVALAAAGNRDSEANDAEQVAARRRIRGIFDRPKLLHPDALTCKPVQGYDSAGFPQNLDAQRMTFLVGVVEPGGN